MKNLTDYELSCGHIQQIKIGADRIELYKEYSVYHVRRFADFTDGRPIQEAWLTLDTIGEARKAFKRQVEIGTAINKKD